MAVEIVHLCHHPEHTELVAGWIYREFWAGKPGVGTATFVDRLREADDPDRIPLSLLAADAGVPVGTVNLVHSDSTRRPDLHPWLAALFVVPERRRQGVGRALVGALLAEARRLGVGELFLGTDIAGYYARFGASVVEQVDGPLVVMRIPLAP